jgi:tetratricopeptide (TPR) repeat protein
MQYELKSISHQGIAEALSKVELYRFLNEPEEAESICRDVLAIEPDNQLALRQLGLAITDQFTGAPGDRFAEARELFGRLADAYERHYYTGIAFEREGKAQLHAGRSPHALLVFFEEALRCFGEAEKTRPAGNDDAILRWNRCVRLLESRPAAEWQGEPMSHFEAADSPPM